MKPKKFFLVETPEFVTKVWLAAWFEMIAMNCGYKFIFSPDGVFLVDHGAAILYLGLMKKGGSIPAIFVRVPSFEVDLDLSRWLLDFEPDYERLTVSHKGGWVVLPLTRESKIMFDSRDPFYQENWARIFAKCIDCTVIGEEGSSVYSLLDMRGRTIGVLERVEKTCGSETYGIIQIIPKIPFVAEEITSELLVGDSWIGSSFLKFFATPKQEMIPAGEDEDDDE